MRRDSAMRHRLRLKGFKLGLKEDEMTAGEKEGKVSDRETKWHRGEGKGEKRREEEEKWVTGRQSDRGEGKGGRSREEQWVKEGQRNKRIVKGKRGRETKKRKRAYKEDERNNGRWENSGTEQIKKKDRRRGRGKEIECENEGKWQRDRGKRKRRK